MEDPGPEANFLGSKFKLSKIPLILLILSFILLLACLIILILTLIQVKKEDTQKWKSQA